ncbi:MAG: transglutaminaseTgpA domain-containing protein [Candidatus Omnitrophota bacterium]|nr:transglutaminaseTgpA domain-containing protein [Candidatus Omnitrophota bacterium]
MNRDFLYFHFANLGLIMIGILSAQKILGPIITAGLLAGIVAGFFFSWSIRKARPPHIDTFIGMLSLASVVIILSRFYEVQITFENLIKIFSTALVWLSLFQSFGLEDYKNYNIVQFISVCLLIASVSLALENEAIYVFYLTVFLFLFIFTTRLGLVCKKQTQGSVIIGDKEEIMSLWQQIKIGAIMFSIVLMLSALVYPMVPRFNSLSLSWVPASLLGLPEKIPLLKLINDARQKIKDKKNKKDQLITDNLKKRETSGDKIQQKKLEKQKEKQTSTERFKAGDFDKSVDVLKIESLTIKADKNEIPLDQKANLKAELKLTDGSGIPATRLVDWKVIGSGQGSGGGIGRVMIDKDGNITPRGPGFVTISASYMGTFSNDVKIKIKEPLKPKKKRGFLFYFFIFFLWLLLLSLVILTIRTIIRVYTLTEMRELAPKRFIKELYFALCRALKFYGVRKMNYTAYREFYKFIKELIRARPEPMYAFTENFMESHFSEHEITTEHSHKYLDLFHETKDVILERDDKNSFLRGILFRLYLLDILLIPKK